MWAKNPGRMTESEYLEYDATHEGKHEFYNGEVVALAGASEEHGAVVQGLSVALSNAGMVYVGDRQGDRVQVFDKMGNFKRNIWVRTGTATLPDKRGTAWWTGFSPDREQKFLYVMNGRNEQVHILDHASGSILSSFGRPGHQLGNFTHGHSLAVDSKGNMYVADTNWGRRVQKFKPVA